MPTMLDKIWQAHLVAAGVGQPDLIYVDRHLMHEVTSPQAFAALDAEGRRVRRPDLTYAVADHVVPTTGRERPLDDQVAEQQLAALETNCRAHGIQLIGMDDPRQGVIHVTMPELGLILPGNTVFCGDSHTATHGAFGALAFGIGTSEVEHILATQTLRQKKPRAMAVRVAGRLEQGCYAKDLVLAVIAHLGAGGGTGFAIEYMGEQIRALSMEERMTLCNMSVECGARSGMIAPDQTTYDYLEGRPHAPAGPDFVQAVAYWKTLPSDPDAGFDRTETVNIAGMSPRVTWGTNPAQSAGVDQAVPDPAAMRDSVERKAAEKALEYMGLTPGRPLAETPVDYVFIGSCTNGRLEDLRAAAAVARKGRVKDGVTALVVPGSGQVKTVAEAEGLDRVFTEAGFEWRQPGCSMCLAMNPDVLPSGKRSASTSNRNFVDRQGRGGRTHLVSPATAAACALAGRLADVREFI